MRCAVDDLLVIGRGVRGKPAFEGELELERNLLLVDLAVAVAIPRRQAAPGGAQLADSQAAVTVRIQELEKPPATLRNRQHQAACGRAFLESEIGEQLLLGQLAVAVSIGQRE